MAFAKEIFRSLDLILCSCVCYVVSMSMRREQKHYFFGFALRNRDQFDHSVRFFGTFSLQFT